MQMTLHLLGLNSICQVCSHSLRLRESRSSWSRAWSCWPLILLHSHSTCNIKGWTLEREWFVDQYVYWSTNHSIFKVKSLILQLQYWMISSMAVLVSTTELCWLCCQLLTSRSRRTQEDLYLLLAHFSFTSRDCTPVLDLLSVSCLCWSIQAITRYMTTLVFV